MEGERELDTHQTRLVAATAACDPRSVTKVNRGEPIRSSVAERVVRAMSELEAVGRIPKAAEPRSGRRGRS